MLLFLLRLFCELGLSRLEFQGTVGPVAIRSLLLLLSLFFYLQLRLLSTKKQPLFNFQLLIFLVRLHFRLLPRFGFSSDFTNCLLCLSKFFDFLETFPLLSLNSVCGADSVCLPVCEDKRTHRLRIKHDRLR
jgi:hypothetical protein